LLVFEIFITALKQGSQGELKVFISGNLYIAAEVGKELHKEEELGSSHFGDSDLLLCLYVLAKFS
jgi:hypothetical protein